MNKHGKKAKWHKRKENEQHEQGGRKLCILENMQKKIREILT